MDGIHPVSAELNVSEKKVDETLNLEYMKLRFDETYGKDSNDGSEFLTRRVSSWFQKLKP